jgi:hypothetical protein
MPGFVFGLSRKSWLDPAARLTLSPINYYCAGPCTLRADLVVDRISDLRKFWLFQNTRDDLVDPTTVTHTRLT